MSIAYHWCTMLNPLLAATDPTIYIVAIPSTLAAIAAILTAVNQYRAASDQREMKNDVHETKMVVKVAAAATAEVKAAIETNNGKTIGETIRQAGSMAALAVDPVHRTTEEDHLVVMLTERERTAGEERREAAALVVDTASELAGRTTGDPGDPAVVADTPKGM